MQFSVSPGEHLPAGDHFIILTGMNEIDAAIFEGDDAFASSPRKRVHQQRHRVGI